MIILYLFIIPPILFLLLIISLLLQHYGKINTNFTMKIHDEICRSNVLKIVWVIFTIAMIFIFIALALLIFMFTVVGT